MVVPAPPAAPRLIGTTFLAFGDSITAGEISDDRGAVLSIGGGRSFPLRVVPELSYPTKLAELLRAAYPDQADQIRVINAGVSGESIDDGAARLPGALAGAKPDALLLLEGINGLDLAAILHVIDELRANIGAARAAGVKAVFLSTLTPCVPGSFRGGDYAAAVQPLDDRIRALAAAEHAELVDAFAAIAGREAELIGADGLHLNAAGYEAVALVFRDVIAQRFQVGSNPR